jgi:alginate O-acetyltransferase complex protein AlgF
MKQRHLMSGLRSMPKQSLSADQSGVAMRRLAGPRSRLLFLLPAMLATCLFAAGAEAAEGQLYDTGPAQDASFLRFVNASDKPIAISANGRNATVTLDAAKPATNYFSVKANSAIEGTVTQAGATSASVSLKVAPSAFATVITLANGGALKTLTIAETPDDFNGMKASLAFYAVDARCTDAGLDAAGRDIALFTKVGQGTLARRSINPVRLSVQLMCGGKPSGAPLDLGELQAGQRYSVFAVPAENGPRLFLAADTLAR